MRHMRGAVGFSRLIRGVNVEVNGLVQMIARIGEYYPKIP
jgi:hypothetical protein